MTDAEINLAIAKIEFAGKELYPCADHVDVRLGAGDYTCVDYCNNWEDIGPIIEREEMRLDPLGFCEWEATFFEEDDGYFEAKWYGHAETPMKAAALCYLKTQGIE